MHKTTRLVVLFVVWSTAAMADVPQPTPPLTLHRAEGAIHIDGDLSDPGWKNAAVIDKFYETSPADNTPPKVKTIAYITYDDHNLYVGIRCEDPEPSKIRAPYVERDNVIGTDDNIAIFLDTRNDKRTAMELRVNPRGIQATESSTTRTSTKTSPPTSSMTRPRRSTPAAGAPSTPSPSPRCATPIAMSSNGTS